MDAGLTSALLPLEYDVSGVLGADMLNTLITQRLQVDTRKQWLALAEYHG